MTAGTTLPHHHSPSSSSSNVITITDWAQQLAALKTKRMYARYLRVLQLDQLLTEISFVEQQLQNGPVTRETISTIRNLLQELRHRIRNQQAHQLQAACHRTNDKIKTFLA
jgi:hypothetical protein